MMMMMMIDGYDDKYNFIYNGAGTVKDYGDDSETMIPMTMKIIMRSLVVQNHIIT